MRKKVQGRCPRQARAATSQVANQVSGRSPTWGDWTTMRMAGGATVSTAFGNVCRLWAKVGMLARGGNS